LSAGKDLSGGLREIGLKKAPQFALISEESYVADSRLDRYPSLTYKLVTTAADFMGFLLECLNHGKGSRREWTTISYECHNSCEILYFVPAWAEKCGAIRWQRWSLRHFVGKDRYFETEFESNTSFLRFIRELPANEACRHLVLDSRALLTDKTGFAYLKELIKIAQMSAAANKSGTKVVCWSMDNTDKKFDLVSSLITSKNGLILSQVCSPRKTSRLHNRQIGPGPWCLRPEDLEGGQQTAYRDIEVYFGGLLYPNRTKILDVLAKELESRSVNYLYTSKRDVGWEDYLKILRRSMIVVHTSVYGGDEQTTHFNNKAIEAAQMGCLVIAQQTSELDSFFGSMRGYVPFSTAYEAVNQCLYYLDNTKERLRISQHGTLLATTYADALQPWPRAFELL